MIIKNTERSELTYLEKFEEHIKIIETKSKLNRKQIIQYLSVCITLVFFGIFGQLVSFVATTYYPIIWSLKAIKSKEAEEDKQWLTYWVIYAIFVFLDGFSGLITLLIPFYFFIKTMILFWMYLPNFKGAVIFYDICVRHFLRLSHKYNIAEAVRSKDSLKTEVMEILKSKGEKEIISNSSNNNDGPVLSPKNMSSKIMPNLSAQNSQQSMDDKKNN
jgi:receptor expression-enhancing protein 5/6